MKNYLRFLSPVLLLLAVVMGGGKSVAQTQWQLVTSDKDLIDEAEYLIVSQNGDNYYALAKPQTNNFTTVEIQIVDNVVSVDAATNSEDTTKPFALTLKKSGNNWIFYDALTNKYINGGGKTKSGKNNYFKEVNSVEKGVGTGKNNGIWTIS